MATAPAGQSCGNCPFWVGGDCRRELPKVTPGIWPRPPAEHWCPYWSVWPARTPSGVPGSFTYGTTAPNPATGSNGDYYAQVRTDGTSISEVDVFQKQSGAWVAVATITP